MENLISTDKPMPVYVEKDQPVIPVALSLCLPKEMHADEESGGRCWTMVGKGKGYEWNIARRRVVDGKAETVEPWAERTTHFGDVCVLVFVHAEKKTVKPAYCHIHSLSYIVDNEANQEKLKKMGTEAVEAWIADGAMVFETVS